MNIKRAKEEIEHTVKAYLAKDALGEYAIPAIRQRPILLMGPPGIGKTQVMEQVARECGVALVAYTITHHTRQSAVGLPFIRQRHYGDKDVSVTEYTMSEIIASVYAKMEPPAWRVSCSSTRSTACPRRWPPPCCNFCSARPSATRLCLRAGSSWRQATRRSTTRVRPGFDLVTLDRVRRMDIEPTCRSGRTTPALPTSTAPS